MKAPAMPLTLHEQRRRARSLTVSRLAALVGCSHAYVSQVEKRRRPASPAYRSKVAPWLGAPSVDLFDDEGLARELAEAAAS